MQLLCFYCRKPLTASAQQLGGEVTCPSCGKVVRLPAAEELADSNEKESHGHHWLTDSISGLASLLIHMGLIFVFAAVTCDYRSGVPEGEEVTIGELPGVDLTDSSGEVLDAAEIEQSSDSANLEEMLTEVTPPAEANANVGEEVSLSQLLPKIGRAHV